MELVGGAETMALDGRPRVAPRPAADVRDHRRGRAPDLLLRRCGRSTFLSIHPDYLLVHRLEPQDAGHTQVICEWLFEEETIARPDFDPSDAVAFWDLTNQQDWHVCELQQRGTRSRSWVAGRYSNQEASRPRVRPDGRRPLRRRRRREPAHRPRALRRAAAEGRIPGTTDDERRATARAAARTKDRHTSRREGRRPHGSRVSRPSGSRRRPAGSAERRRPARR